MSRASQILAVAVASGLLWGNASVAFAGTVTDLSLSTYKSGTWGANQTNGTQIFAASTSGNAGSGLTFGDWNGSYVEVGPDSGATASPLTITFASSVALNNDAVVNTLINSFYGQANAVNATITFTNSNSNSAAFSLVGNQTMRDYNPNIYTNTLQGYNSTASYGQVTAQNWWNNTSGQRLDAQTFVLPSAWSGTSLVSMTISNPYSSGSTNDVVLSAVQVNDQTLPVPEPMSLTLLLVGFGGIVATTAGRRRARSQPPL